VRHSLPQISGARNRRGERSLLTGGPARDYLLRRLALGADLGFDVPDDLRRALGDAVGGSFTFELEIKDPNGQVEV
jgi:hypothetical protein